MSVSPSISVNWRGGAVGAPVGGRVAGAPARRNIGPRGPSGICLFEIERRSGLCRPSVPRRLWLTVEIVLLGDDRPVRGLRLYAVLGQRTGHEQQPVTRPEPRGGEAAAQPRGRSPPIPPSRAASPTSRVPPPASARSSPPIPSFDVARFLEGAQAAYRMILEAFWKGDREELA